MSEPYEDEGYWTLCSYCGGTGEDGAAWYCPFCGGKGEQYVEPGYEEDDDE